MFFEGIGKPVSVSDPAGIDLSVSGELLALEAMAKPMPVTNSEGKRVTDDFGEREPDWIELERKCVELLNVSRDLRVAAFYTAALLRTHGLDGLAGGLGLIKEMLLADAYHAHPQPDSNDSIAERWYTLAGLSALYKRDGDLLRIIEGLRGILLVRKNTGSISYREVLAARSKSGGMDSAALDQMKGEWRSVPASARGEIAKALAVASATALEIEKIMLEQTPEALAPSNGEARPLAALVQELRGMIEFVGEPILKQKIEKVDAKRAAPLPLQEGIHSRADAVKALQEVAEFFRRTEPASPIPYFIQRAARLVDRDFMGLLDELVPEAVAGFKTLAGVDKTPTSNP